MPRRGVKVDRKPLKIIVREKNNDNLRERYGGVSGSFVLEGEMLVPRDDMRRDIVGIFMHPTAATTMLPLPVALSKLGMHCCVASSRYPNNDSLLFAENVVKDLGSFIHHLRSVIGYKRVVLFGWSGGGALAAMYQSQAENPTITQTATGKPVDFSELIPADMLILVAAHCGRASYLTEALDPTIFLCQRNSDPDSSSDLEKYNIYGPNAPSVPYSKDFLRRYRQAQKERSQRITDWARTLPPETPFIVEGTMADPRWLDITIDPNERPTAGKCFLGECSAANDMPTGLARFTTAGSWLSQWAEGVSELDALKHLPNIEIPTLVITNGADDGVPATHGPMMFSAIKHASKQFHNIEGATHYYIKGNPPNVQRRQLFECVSVVVSFIDTFSSIPLEELRNEFSATNWKFENPASNSEVIGNVSSNNSLRNLPIAPKAKGFNHIAMVCSDMAATVRFYSGILGFPLIKTLELPDGGQHFFFDCGDKTGGLLAFFWWPDVAKKRAPGIACASKDQMDRGIIPRSVPGSVNHIAFDYPESGLEALRERLKAAGIWVSPKIFHAENEIGFAGSRDDPDVSIISIYLWGPDGEMIEFSSATNKMFPIGVHSRVLHEPKFVGLSKL